MKVNVIISLFAILAFTACKKDVNTFQDRLQGEWSRNCSSQGDETFRFRSDTAFRSLSKTGFLYFGHVTRDTLFYGGARPLPVPSPSYVYPMRFSSDYSILYIGTSADNTIWDTTCADVSYRRMK